MIFFCVYAILKMNKFNSGGNVLLPELEKQLNNKKKTIAELADLISLRTDRNPNFSLLLGAGCSVSSGIKSANTLVTQWRSEFCKGVEDVEEQKRFLKQYHSDWYDPNKEYSSLFEKKFDLQRHRRMFVEKEVADKTPSIGYAYLTSLVKEDYFHTLFTTNFDDLINEAFYLYSEQRPIVCAHDSSINSVTVTSSRPKIIKLHGDYLFDDIKATTRETESLEQNMKAKFTEFAKDFGLIVVGYSGGDRSIMDVISTLLKNDSYFKNGIYWCLRKDSEISEDLKKLLWKEKVYFVEVEGFDELFAEIHEKFNDVEIPITTSSISKTPSETISKLLNSDSFKQSSSPILQKAYEQLVKGSKRTTLMNLVLPRDKEEITDGEESFSDDELIIRIEIDKLLSNGAYRQAIEKGKLALESMSKPNVRNEIYKSIIKAYRALGELKEAVLVTDELISEQPYIAGHHLLKAEILTKTLDKLESVNKAIEINKFWYRGYYRKASLLSSQANDLYGKERDDAIAQALAAAEEGLKRDPSLDNPCWVVKFRLISDHEKNKSLKEEKKKSIIEQLNVMNPESIRALRLRMSGLSEEKNQNEILTFINEIESIKKKSSPNLSASLDEIIFDGYAKLNDTEIIEKAISRTKTSYELSRKPDLTVAIANVLRKKMGKDNEAIDILKACYQIDSDPDIVDSLLQALIDNGNIAEAEGIISKVCRIMPSSMIYRKRIYIFDAKGDYDSAITELKRNELNTGRMEYAEYLYYLIKNKKYSDAEYIGRDFLQKINFSAEATSEIVNYELASKRLKNKFNGQRLETTMQFNSSDPVKAAIYAILGKKNEMLACIKKAMNIDLTFRFDAQKWPVFDEYKQDQEFIKSISY